MRGSQIREVLDKAWRLEAQGRRIMHLGVGQPNFEAPRCAVVAAQRALEERSMTSYIANAGMGGLREAVAEEIYGKRSPLAEICADDVVVTSGSMFAFFTSSGTWAGLRRELEES